MLSSLGGWLRSRGHWTVVRKAAPRFRFEGSNWVDELRGVRAQAPPRDRREHAAARRPRPRGRRRLAARAGPADRARRARASPGRGLLDLSAVGARRHPGPRPLRQDRLRRRAAAVPQPRCAGEGDRAQVQGTGRLIVAHLYQRFFIVVREPVKVVRAPRSRHAVQARGADHDRRHPRHRPARTTSRSGRDRSGSR